ncbi:MAG: glycosyltransferase family 4 protein [Eubacterium sp.]|nr:glycosyltransferase family 4 protein [Eubacterium sp.]
MKILYVATVRSHIGQFHIPFIKKLKELGCTVDGAYRDNSSDKPGLDTSALDNVYEIPFTRTPYSFDNIKAYFRLKKLLKANNYDAVHCHTPMGGVITRLAAKSLRKKGLKVIYTAHGFHFYNGASKKNWLLYYNAEKYLAKYTDCLITINREDYEIAKKDFSSAGSICKVNGVGVDFNKFTAKTAEEKKELRKRYGYSDEDFLIIYPADFCYRKNHIMLLEAVKLVYDKHKNVKLLLPGLQTENGECVRFCNENGLNEAVEFLDYRRDIYDFAGMCDLSVSTSRQEGLPINLIEAMGLGNPILASDVRGNNDVVEDGVNGYLVKLNDSAAMAERICGLIENREKLEEFSENGRRLSVKYGTEPVIEKMLKVYRSLELIG